MKCAKCKNEFDESFFNKKRVRKNGEIVYQSYCKNCNKTYKNAHYLANKDLYLKKSKAYDAKNRDIIMSYIVEYYKDHPCIDCGETDPIVLEFDHRCDKKYNISNLSSSGDHPLETVKLEISKCDVRCANCHRRKTAKDRKYKILDYI